MIDMIAPGARIRAIADMVGRSSVVADVGCDHGKLPVYLLQLGSADRAIAMDISAPSLEKARRLSARYGLQDRLTARLSDGLRQALPGEADVIVIAGMGGELISSILSASLDVVRSAERIIMQPMSGIEELRRYLGRSGLGIYDESLVEESGRIYQLIAARAGSGAAVPAWFCQDEYLLGHILFEKRDPLLRKYIELLSSRLMSRLAEAERGGARPVALEQSLRRLNELIRLTETEVWQHEAE